MGGWLLRLGRTLDDDGCPPAEPDAPDNALDHQQLGDQASALDDAVLRKILFSARRARLVLIVLLMKMWTTRSFVLLNVVVAAVYLWIGHTAWWMEPELRDIPGASGGGPIIWFFATAYILGAVVAVDGLVTGWHVYRVLKKKSGSLGVAAVTVVPLWIVVIAIDFAHH